MNTTSITPNIMSTPLSLENNTTPSLEDAATALGLILIKEAAEMGWPILENQFNNLCSYLQNKCFPTPTSTPPLQRPCPQIQRGYVDSNGKFTHPCKGIKTT